MKLVSGLIDNACFVQDTELDNATFLYGTVVYDQLGRFEKDHWLLSSVIQKTDDNIIIM